MTWDAKDKAILKATALIGYCQSADPESLADADVRQRWIEHLECYVEKVVAAIDAVFDDSSVQESK